MTGNVIKEVLFDWDGTCANTEAISATVTRKANAAEVLELLRMTVEVRLADGDSLLQNPDELFIPALRGTRDVVSCPMQETLPHGAAEGLRHDGVRAEPGDLRRDMPKLLQHRREVDLRRFHECRLRHAATV